MCPDLKLQVSRSEKAWISSSESNRQDGVVSPTQTLEMDLTVKYQRTVGTQEEAEGGGHSQGSMDPLLTLAESHKETDSRVQGEESYSPLRSHPLQFMPSTTLLTYHGTSQCHDSTKSHILFFFSTKNKHFQV